MEVLFGDHAARLNDLEGVLASRDNVGPRCTVEGHATGSFMCVD